MFVEFNGERRLYKGEDQVCYYFFLPPKIEFCAEKENSREVFFIKKKKTNKTSAEAHVDEDA